MFETTPEILVDIYHYIDNHNRTLISSTCKTYRYIYIKYFKPSLQYKISHCFYNKCWICDKECSRISWKYVMIYPMSIIEGGVKICSYNCYIKMLRHSMKQCIKSLKIIEKGPCYKYLSKDKIKVKYAMINRFNKTIKNPTCHDENYVRRCLNFIRRTDDLIL